jgi:hypothetical protein
VHFLANKLKKMRQAKVKVWKFNDYFVIYNILLLNYL